MLHNCANLCNQFWVLGSGAPNLTFHGCGSFRICIRDLSIYIYIVAFIASDYMYCMICSSLVAASRVVADLFELYSFSSTMSSDDASVLSTAVADSVDQSVTRCQVEHSASAYAPADDSVNHSLDVKPVKKICMAKYYWIHRHRKIVKCSYMDAECIVTERTYQMHCRHCNTYADRDLDLCATHMRRKKDHLASLACTCDTCGRQCKY